nr:hypothetical protein [Tanacetum cinerariifolium]
MKLETDKEVEEAFKDKKNEIETKEEVEEVFDDKTKKKEDDDTKYYNSPPAIKELVYHEWLLKNPRPSRVKSVEMALRFTRDTVTTTPVTASGYP